MAQDATGPRRRGRPPTVTAEDWAEAALEAIAELGVAGVRVEELARTLGTSKGSCYWYFPTREDLIAAAFARWEAGTQEIIARLEALPDPQQRLRRLRSDALAAERSADLELSLLTTATHPDALAVVRRVTRHRLDFIAACYRALGHSPEQAEQEATSAYADYLGRAALRRHLPELVPPAG